MSDISWTEALKRLRRKMNGPASTYHESVVLDVNVYEALLNAVDAGQYLISECYRTPHNSQIPWEAVENLQDNRDKLVLHVLGPEAKP